MWIGKDYGAPLPLKTKRAVLRFYKGVCHWCLKPGGTEVDHVINRKSGGSDDVSNLRPIHQPCHKLKTQQEAQAARAARKRRPAPPHPGTATK